MLDYISNNFGNIYKVIELANECMSIRFSHNPLDICSINMSAGTDFHILIWGGGGGGGGKIFGGGGCFFIKIDTIAFK